jgi:hypothetical protein
MDKEQCEPYVPTQDEPLVDPLVGDVTLDRLVDALRKYEEKDGALAIPSVVLYSDGSGHISTMDAGDIYHFSAIGDAISFLEGAVN